MSRLVVLELRTQPSSSTVRSTSRIAIRSSYRRMYWYQQHVQFLYWLTGGLARPVYRSWLLAREREHLINIRFGALDYRTAWSRCSDWLADVEFSVFMERIFAGQTDEALDSARRLAA